MQNPISQESSKSGLIWTTVILVLFLGVVGVIAFNGPSDDGPQGKQDIPVSEVEHAKGNMEAAIVLVEYSDFQCPACQFYAAVVDQMVSEFGSEVKFVYKHFPLRSIHRNADISAQAAEAADLQGAFWRMHDLIFANQKEWSDLSDAATILAQYAYDLGLDVNKFKSDLNSKEVRARVERDYQSATELNLSGTPTFFLDGERIEPKSLDEFRNFLQQAISQDQAG